MMLATIFNSIAILVILLNIWLLLRRLDRMQKQISKHVIDIMYLKYEINVLVKRERELNKEGEEPRKKITQKRS